jgi:hypothetical protein
MKNSGTEKIPLPAAAPASNAFGGGLFGASKYFMFLMLLQI